MIITYGEVSKLADGQIYHRNLGKHLYDIADICKENDLPYLTAIVCKK